MLTSYGIQYFSMLLFALTAAIIHCAFAEYASDCITTENGTGLCVPIKSCRKALEMLKNYANLDAVAQNRTKDSLRQSQCYKENDVPYVCCPPTEIQINSEIYEHLSQLNCGLSSNRKIAHGEVADIYAYRWSALLVYSSGENIFRCGASLISERYVLTAAHCFREIPIAVRLGEYDLSTEVDCVKKHKRQACLESYEDIAIEKLFIHANYAFGGLHHDIALLRLARAVEFKKNIRPICLPISEDLQRNEVDQYLVAGWGRTENGTYTKLTPKFFNAGYSAFHFHNSGGIASVENIGRKFKKRCCIRTTSNVLLFTSIPHRSHEFCEESLRIPRKQHLTPGHICAGGERFRDSCKGDSGGAIFSPNIYTDGVARAIQFGIVSLGVYSCGDLTAPAIYTNVSHYMQWITDHMSIN